MLKNVHVFEEAKMGTIIRLVQRAGSALAEQIPPPRGRQSGTQACRKRRCALIFHLNRLCAVLPLIFSYGLFAALSGCGGTVTVEHPPGTLAASPAAVAFGNVTVGQAGDSTVTLHAGSSGSVQITQLSLSGQGFAIGGQSDLPITVAAGGFYDLSVEFDPTATGTVTGSIAVTSNSSVDGPVVIALSGTGTLPAYVVKLNWDAPVDSPDPVAGYYVYRSPVGDSKYQPVNSSVDPTTSYVDNSVQDGLSYDYFIKSVDNSGVESIPSSVVTVTIPSN